MFKFPAIILGGRFSPLPWQGRGLAYVVVSEKDGGAHIQQGPAASFREAAGARDPGPASGVVTESTPLRSPPTAGEGAGRASEGQALPAALVKRAPAPRSGEERDE
jgi:hypothetical protein